MTLKCVYSVLFFLVLELTSIAQILTVNAGTNQTVCLNSTLTIGANPTAQGGNKPYTYNWTPATFLNSTTVSNPIAANLTTDMWYKVVVTAR